MKRFNPVTTNLVRRQALIGLSSGLAALMTSNLARAAETDTVSPGKKGKKTFRIGFHFWKPGKIYDEAMSGILDGLQLEGIDYEPVMLHSDRDKSRAEENLRKLDEMGLDLIYSLSSAGTKIAKRLKLKTPVIATVINHPTSLGVGQGSDVDATQLTGTSYYVDAVLQLELYTKMFPQANSIGMIYDVNNPAGALAEEPFMRQACELRSLGFNSIGVSEKGELAAAAQSLVDANVDLIVIPTNRLVYSNLETVLDITNQNKVPVVSMNKQGVEYGALAGLYADTYNLGRQTANMARRILKTQIDVAEIGFEYIDEPEIILNMSSAFHIGYQFPPEILGHAAIVMQ